MKYALIINGCSDSYQARAEELYHFAQSHLGNMDKAATIIIHEGAPDSLLKSVFTGQAILIEVRGYQPEILLKILPRLAQGIDLFLLPGDYFGEEISVRLGHRLGGSSLVSALGLTLAQERLVVQKKVYSQHLSSTFEMSGAPVCLALARGLPQDKIVPHPNPEIIRFDHRQDKLNHILASRFQKREQTAGLDQARRLVVGGQGLGRQEEVERLAELARLLGGEMGVSRPVAMKAWAPLTQLVGVSGAMTRPEVCLTFGVSGAAAFQAGIEKSAFIASVNHDPKAAIMSQSDVVVIDDGPTILNELLKILQPLEDR